MCHISYRVGEVDGNKVQPRREEGGWRDRGKESRRKKSAAAALTSRDVSIEVSGTEAFNDSYTLVVTKPTAQREIHETLD